MKTIILVCLTATLAAAAVTAAAETGDATPRTGLEFAVSNDFQLSSFAGSAISWKRLGSATRAWRIGLSPYVSRNDQDYEYQHRDDRAYRAEVTVQRLFLAPLRDGTRGYWGLGPTVSYRYDETSSWREIPGQERESYGSIRRSLDVGLAASVGVEYFFRPNMSLMGEYGFSLTYEHDRNTPDAVTGSTVSLASRSVRLGLCVLY